MYYLDNKYYVIIQYEYVSKLYSKYLLISNISVNEDAQSFEISRKIYSSTAPGDHILLGYHDAQPFETTIINNHIVTAPSAQIVWGYDDAQTLETPQK